MKYFTEKALQGTFKEVAEKRKHETVVEKIDEALRRKAYQAAAEAYELALTFALSGGLIGPEDMPQEDRAADLALKTFSRLIEDAEIEVAGKYVHVSPEQEDSFKKDAALVIASLRHKISPH